MPSNLCPYCQGASFTGAYVEVEPVSELGFGIGYNLCKDCAQWSEFRQSDTFQHPLPEGTDPIPNRSQVE